MISPPPLRLTPLYHALGEHNLTLIQLVIMVHLPSQLGTLSQICRVTPTSITSQRDTLEKKELVTNEESKSDRRAKTLNLTPKGIKTVEDILRTAAAV